MAEELEEVRRIIEAEDAAIRAEVHTDADVLKYVLHSAQDEEGEERPFPILKGRLGVPITATGVAPLQLNVQAFVEDFTNTTEFMISTIAALEQGDEIPVDASKARECSRCARRWLSILHFLAELTPPLHLRCHHCQKRIPVGQDIREMPHRRAQPDFVDMEGNPLELGPNQLRSGTNLTWATAPVVDPRQQCTASDCPLKREGIPHSVGLFAYPEKKPGIIPSMVCAWKTTAINYAHKADNTTRSTIGIDDFWAGNDRIPSQLRDYVVAIMREERIWHGADPKAAIAAFRKEYSREATDKMRDTIVAFKAYHCFYRPLLGESGELRANQLDIIPAHLRYQPERSRTLVDRFLAELTKVEVEDLAADDRDCPLCKGVYEEDVNGYSETTESAVVLPCGHKFGEECLRIAILRKGEGGGEQKCCPFCRKWLYVPKPKPAGPVPAAGNPTEGADLVFGFQV